MGGDGSSLHAERREREFAASIDGAVADVLVVGGGITGAGIALDAAARGLSVVLVERGDLARGTSHASSKLVHGGLRYLRTGGVRVAMESATERRLLMEHVAPHLVRALPIVFPLERTVRARYSYLTQLGLAAGEGLRSVAGTRAATLPRPRRLSGAEMLRLAPGLRGQGFRVALLLWEGQLVDDARLVVAVARTAAGLGARILTRAGVTEVSGAGASVRDELTGNVHEIRARAVINATGVWASELTDAVRLSPSRGSHLVVSTARLGSPTAGMMVPVPGERDRFVFALPQPDGYAYVGLTDEAAPPPPSDDPEASAGEVGFLLDTLNTALREPLDRGDVLATFSGLRPLADDPAHPRSADMSRRHVVRVDGHGVVTVVGGKLTTYRRMAADALDVAVAERGLVAGPCRTARLPLVGAASPATLDAVDAPGRLVRRYGAEAPGVLAEAGGDPALLRALDGDLPVTGAELLFGFRHEGAITWEDLLDRRTRVGLVPSDRQRAAVAAGSLLPEPFTVPPPTPG